MDLAGHMQQGVNAAGAAMENGQGPLGGCFVKPTDKKNGGPHHAMQAAREICVRKVAKGKRRLNGSS